MSRRDLTVERLREVLDYDPETGHFTHNRRPERNAKDKTWNTRYGGKRAGYLHTPSGYWIICIDDVKYKAHRLAHLYMTGNGRRRQSIIASASEPTIAGPSSAWRPARRTASTRGCGAITPRD